MLVPLSTFPFKLPYFLAIHGFVTLCALKSRDTQPATGGGQFSARLDGVNANFVGGAKELEVWLVVYLEISMHKALQSRGLQESMGV